MSNHGFSALERAAQAAEKKMSAKAEQLSAAAERLKKEDVYYRKLRVWTILGMIVGAGLAGAAAWFLMHYRVGVDLELIYGLLPEQIRSVVVDPVNTIIANCPWFDRSLLEAGEDLVLQLSGGAIVLMVAYKLLMHIIALFGDIRLSSMKRTHRKIGEKIDSIEAVQKRLCEETSSGSFSAVEPGENLGKLADKQITAAGRVIKINRVLKTLELLVLLLASYGVLVCVLLRLHGLVIDLGLAGSNHALLICVISIGALCVFVAFFQKAIAPLYGKATKWIMALLVLLYGAALVAWFILWRQQSVDLVSYFWLHLLPLGEDITVPLNTYAGPVLMALLEVHCALRLVVRTDSASERYADENGIVLPMTNGTVRTYSIGKARRMGVVVTVWATVRVFLVAVVTAYAMVNTSGALLMMALVFLMGMAITFLQGLSTDQFEYKYKNKGGAIQSALFLMYLLTALSMMEGQSIISWFSLG